MTKPVVVSLQERKRALQREKVARILEFLKAFPKVPGDFCEDIVTGDLVTSPESWEYLDRLFEVFEMQTPRDLKARVAIGSLVYLVGELGSKIKLRSSNEAVYQMVKPSLTEAEQEYMDALFGEDLRRSAQLIQQLGVLEKEGKVVPPKKARSSKKKRTPRSPLELVRV